MGGRIPSNRSPEWMIRSTRSRRAMSVDLGDHRLVIGTPRDAVALATEVPVGCVQQTQDYSRSNRASGSSVPALTPVASSPTEVAYAGNGNRMGIGAGTSG